MVVRVRSNTFHETISLLGNCPSLFRLGLIVTSIKLVDGGNLIDMYRWNEQKFTAFFVDLVRRLTKLTALLAVLPGAPQSLCIAATATLENIFRPERPCFCVQITDSLQTSNPPNLPQCHFQTLALDPPPLVGALPFHLLSQDNYY